jgi:hypothetical protein
MAQPLINISISAPGFLGLNTEDSQLDQPQAFASIADNCVIDQFGRVGARKGYVYDTTTSTALGSARGVTALYEFTSDAGATVFLSAGNNLILSGDTTLVDETPGGATITADDWKIVEHNNLVYFFQSGHTPLYYDPSTTNVALVSAHPSYTGTVPQGNEVLATSGRLFVADVSGDRSTVYWSDLLQGFAWSGGTSGSLNVSKHWPAGNDNIVALAELNNKLIIFGERSTLIYAGIESPSTMVLEGTLDQIGCAARDSIQTVGDDLIFLSHGGVMKLSRALQNDTNPLAAFSQNVRTDIIAAIDREGLPIKSVYSPEEQFYLITFFTSSIVYCFDMRGALEDGSHRVTSWSSLLPMCFHRCTSPTNTGQLRIGLVNGIATYTGYNDNATESYVMSYLSNPIDFSSTERPDIADKLKFPKRINTTILGFSGSTINIVWGFDYGSNLKSTAANLIGSTIAEFGEAEFGLSEFTSGVILNRLSNNTHGSGENISIGVNSIIDGSLISVQKLDIQALIGRLY